MNRRKRKSMMIIGERVVRKTERNKTKMEEMNGRTYARSLYVCACVCVRVCASVPVHTSCKRNVRTLLSLPAVRRATSMLQRPWGCSSPEACLRSTLLAPDEGSLVFVFPFLAFAFLFFSLLYYFHWAVSSALCVILFFFFFCLFYFTSSFLSPLEL